MDVNIIYFSQTGNTRKVAETMAETFREAGHVARTVSLKKAAPQDAATADLLGVGTPCFSSRAPTPVKAFLATLPPLDGRKAFVFATSGGAPGRVLYDLTHSLQAKAAEVIGGFLARGEVSFTAPCMVGRFPHRPDGEDLAGARRFATAVGEHVSAGRAGPVAGSRPDTFRRAKGFYGLVAWLSTDRFTRLVLPEPVLDPARCNQCQWCLHECPTHNINLAPNPAFGNRCIRCYRCVTGCPKRALDVDLRLSNLAVWSFYNVTFERWLGDIQPGERIY